jgi:hypothetical protein
VAQTPQERRAAQRRIAKELKEGTFKRSTTGVKVEQRVKVRFDLTKDVIEAKKQLFQGKLLTQRQLDYLRGLSDKELRRHLKVLRSTLASSDPHQFMADHNRERGEIDPAYYYQ